MKKIVFRSIRFSIMALVILPATGISQIQKKPIKEFRPADRGIAWYKCFEGTIGKYPITIHLHKMGHTVAGYYFYQSKEQPVYMLGNDTDSGKFRLYCSVQSQEAEDEIFTVTISGNTCRGIWGKGENNKIGLQVFATEKNKSAVSWFDMFYIQGTRDLRPGMPGSPEGSFELATIWPKASASFIKRVLNRELGEAAANQDIGKTLSDKKEEFLAAYLEQNKNVADSEMTEFPFSYSQEQSQWILVAFQSPGVLSLASLDYFFMGGTHGNYSTRFLCFDLAANKEIALKDVLTPAGIKKLNLCWKKFYEKK